MSVFVIAEAGVNHNGDVARAEAMVDAAAAAGADAVKFQTFRADEVAVEAAPKAAYQVRAEGAAEPQLAMLRRLELDADAHHRLVRRCKDAAIEFLSTPFDLASLGFLVQDLGLETLKLPSGEITNGPLLLAAARTPCRLIVSTGMSTMDDVSRALGILAFGRLEAEAPPHAGAAAAALDSATGKAALAATVTLLHCTSDYPAPAEEANLRAMDSLADAFGLPVGLSDHTPGVLVSVAAVGRGARVIEKHFTLDRRLPGPDHAASLQVHELGELVLAVRQAAVALGDGHKRVMPSERDTLMVARRSLVAVAPIRRGEPFTTANLGAKRPGTGVSPMRYWEWLGRTAERDYAAGELIGP